MSGEVGLRFVPSRVDGLPGVTEAAVYPDRLELLARGRWASFQFAEKRSLASSCLALAAVGPARMAAARWLPVGERDWFHPPSERFFRFYTRPPIVVYMADEPRDTEYGSTLFRRVQDVMLEGGFNTWDLG